MTDPTTPPGCPVRATSTVSLTPPADPRSAADVEAARRIVVAELRSWRAGSFSPTGLNEIVEAARRHGVHRLTCADLRLAAQAVDQSRLPRDAAARWLLERLSLTVPLRFDEYAAVSVLLDGLYDSDAVQYLANVLEYLQELVLATLDEAIVSRLDDDDADPHTGATERSAAIRHLGSLSVRLRAAQDLNRARANVAHLPSLAIRSVVPLSSEPHELVFLALVQATELIFRSVAALLTAARGSFALADPARAIGPLDRAVLASALLPDLARLYTLVIPTARWHEIRDHICEPSAIQGCGFPSMLGTLSELEELAGHSRVPDERQDLALVVEALTKKVRVNVAHWQLAHPGMVKRQNGGLADNPAVIPFLTRRAAASRRKVG